MAPQPLLDVIRLLIHHIVTHRGSLYRLFPSALPLRKMSTAWKWCQMQTMAVWLRALDCTLMLTELMSCSKKQHRNLWRRRQMYFCQVRRKFSSNAWLRFHPVIGILGRSIGPSQKLELAEILESIKNQSSKSKQQNLKVDLQPFVEAYNFYKINYGRNIQFDPSATNLCEYRMVLTLLMIIIKHFSYMTSYNKHQAFCLQPQWSLQLNYKWSRSTLTRRPLMRLRGMWRW